MSIIYTVNDWRVEDSGDRFVITNSSHPEWINYYIKETNRYRWGFKRVPKQVDRAILRAMNITSDLPSDRTFGIEIECFHPTNYSIRQDVERALVSAGINASAMSYTHQVVPKWKITTDSSIHGGCGLEVVSPILKNDTGIEEVKKVMRILSDLGCRVNKTTGMHVHIGAKDLSSSQLHKCFLVYKNNEYLFDSLVARSRRGSNNSYCKSLAGLTDFSRDRYVKLNYQAYLKYGTLEFRQHQGSLNGDKAEHWIKLVRSVVEYCKSSRAVRTYPTVEAMIKDLGLEEELGWYLERVEELAS